MCTPPSHVFIYTTKNTQTPIPVGLRCVCKKQRWGTDAELRALDEIARCEAWLAVPWHQPTRWP